MDQNKIRSWMTALAGIAAAFAVGELRATPVTLKASDATNESSMSGTSGCAGWSDGSKAAGAGKDYLVGPGLALRTPKDDLASYTFKGDSLTLSGAQIQIKLADGQAGKDATLVLPYLKTVDGESTLLHGSASRTYTVKGTDWFVDVGSALKLTPLIRSNDIRNFVVDVEKVRGEGDLRVFQNSGTAGAGLTTGSNYVRLSGDFSEFTGRLTVTKVNGASLECVFTDGLTWLGEPAAADADSVSVAGGATLRFDDSIESGANRGFNFGSAGDVRGKISVAAGKTVRIYGNISGANGFEKIGAGTLVICGTTEGLDETKIAVTEGVVKKAGDLVIEAMLEGIDVFEDGNAYGPTLTVTEPASGWTAEWSVDGGEYVATRPTFSEACEHAVSCRVSADDYPTRTLSAAVKIKLHDIVATAADVRCLHDGQPHGCAVTVTEPAEGYQLAWSLDGIAFSEVQPTPDYGKTRVYCRVSKEHYAAKVVDAFVQVVSDRSVYVSLTGSNVAPYDTPETAALTLQAALDMAQDGGKVILLPGTYSVAQAENPIEGCLYKGRISVDRGVEIVGSPEGSVILQGPGAQTEAGLDLKSGTKLSGCTMRNFNTAVVSAVNTVISNCVFRGGVDSVRLGGLLTHSIVTEYGGKDAKGKQLNCQYGVKIESSSALISHCEISRGFCYKAQSASDTWHGGKFAAVLAIEKSERIRLEDTAIIATTNITVEAGSPVVNFSGAPAVLTRCRFVGNVARSPIARLSWEGADRSPLYATNCLFAANESVATKSWFPDQPEATTERFAEIFAWGEMVNCTFVGNVAKTMFVVNGDFRMKVVNCVFQDNEIEQYENGIQLMRDVSYSLYPEATGENGNVVGPAKFNGADPSNPYRLAVGSPGIDAGTNLGWTKADRDLIGNCRLVGRRVDMGCYEYPPRGLVIYFW